MLTSSRAGAIRLFASSHVFEEVYRRAPTQERRGFTAEQMLTLFESRYLPEISFVEGPVCRSEHGHESSRKQIATTYRWRNWPWRSLLATSTPTIPT